MIRKIIPLAIPLLALVGGAFAGDLLRAPDPGAPPADHAVPAEPTEGADAHPAPAAEGGGAPTEAAWFSFPTQFFVPLVRQGDPRDMMILTLTVQTDAASVDLMARTEHSLRDALLRQLLIHANTGGFDGNFTADRNLALLRESLLDAARGATELPVSAILIEAIARQAS